MRILVVGAGGHGRTILEAMRQAETSQTPLQAVGFVDDAPGLLGTLCDGLPVLGVTQDIVSIEHDAVIVGLGDNRKRKAVFESLSKEGVVMATVIHPSATVARTAQIGVGTYIGAQAVIGVDAVVGDNVIITGTGCIGHHSRIESHAHIGPGVTTTRAVTIGEGVLLGAGATVLSDVQVGAWSSVMAASLVALDVPENVLAGGSPARAIRHLTDE